MDRIAHKWRRLDEEHLYILTDHGEVVPLTEREKQLNITIRQKLATASVANAPPPPSSPAPPPKGSPPHRHQELGEEVLPAERDGQEWREDIDLRNGLAARRTVAVAVLYRHGGKSLMPCPNHLRQRQSRCPTGCLRPRSPRRSAVGAREKREAQQGSHRAKRAASATPAARDRLTGTTSKAGSACQAGSACPPPPKPARGVPHFILQAHEVRPGDELDTDWTLHVDWGEEQRLREKRNELIRAQLMDGKTAAYRQSGWSLYPRVHSNDLCMYIPVRFAGPSLRG